VSGNVVEWFVLLSGGSPEEGLESRCARVRCQEGCMGICGGGDMVVICVIGQLLHCSGHSVK